MGRIVRSRRTTRGIAWAGTFAMIAGLATATMSSPAVAKSRKTTSTPGSPSISVTSPGAGSTVSATVTVSGTASDTVSLSSVAVSIDGGAWQAASGTTSWSYSLNTASYANGSHTIAAQATDTSGQTATASETVTIQNSTTVTGGNGSISWGSTSLTDPSTGKALMPIGWSRQSEWGSVSILLAVQSFTSQPEAFFRDSSTGATSYVTLPVDTTGGWSDASYIMTSASDLWVASGAGPIYLHHYRLSGSTLPSSASLVASQTFGDTDSRMGDLTVLASGALVLAWHQQGITGQQGQYVAYCSPSGRWQILGPLQFMPSESSNQVVGQNPSDKSIWVLSDPDAWSAIGAIHLTEGPTGLSVDWTNATYITTTQYGTLGPDPENPDLELAPDPSTGTLALAYEDDNRYTFSNGDIGSYVSIDRIAADGTMSFTQLPVYVERVSSLGLMVQSGSTWLAYRPVNPTTLSYQDLYVDEYQNGSWLTGADLGTLYSTSVRTGFGISRSELSAQMADGTAHFFTVI